MNKNLQNELKKIQELLPKIERFGDLKLGEIPEVYRKEINDIKIIPQFTAGGIESMISVLNNLYFAEYYAKENLTKPDVSPTAPIPNITPQANPITPKPVPPPAPLKPTPKPMPNPTIVPSPSPTQAQEKYRKESLDFGPYKQNQQADIDKPPQKV